MDERIVEKIIKTLRTAIGRAFAVFTDAEFRGWWYGWTPTARLEAMATMPRLIRRHLPRHRLTKAGLDEVGTPICFRCGGVDRRPHETR